MAISYITSDGTIRHNLTGDTFGIPSITQATADAITSKPVGLMANIDGKLAKWDGTIWEFQLKEDDVAEPDLQQFITGPDGRYIVATLDKRITSNFPAVTTEFRKIHGSRTSPQYNFLSLPASLTTAQKQWLNRVKVVHCGLVVPAVLVPNKPTSPLPIYTGLTNPTSPLATYASQAAMTADFANQVLDSYYYFTGNNGAYKYNGTATDSINNYVRELYMLGDQSAQVTNEYYYYTGSTSAWRKTATSTGVIGNYIELVGKSPLPVYADQAAMLADQASQTSGQNYYYIGSNSAWIWNGTSGGVIENYNEDPLNPNWEEWGTKPEWLIITGDAYLVGENNLNELDFIYHELIKIDSVSYADVIVVTNTAHTGMNADSEINRILAKAVVINDYNENEEAIEPNTVRNLSTFGEEIPMTLLNLGATTHPAFYEEVSTDNYALCFGISANTTSSNAASAYRRIEFNTWLSRLYINKQMSVIMVANFPVTPQTLSGNRVLFHNTNSGLTSGLRVVITSAERLEMRGYHSSGSRSVTSAVDKTFPRSNNYWFIGFSVKENNATSRQYDAYRASLDAGVAFEQIINFHDTNSANVVFDNGEDFNFEFLSGQGLYGQKNDHLLKFPFALTSAQFQLVRDYLNLA